MNPPKPRAGLDDLIGAIYDCVIDPSLWHDTLDAIRRRYGFFNVILAVNHTINQEMVLSVGVNVPDEMAAILQQYSWAIGDLWGGWARVNAAPLEEPIVSTDVISREARETNPYYQHFAAPQGIDSAVAIALARDSYTIANIALGRHISSPPLTSEHVDELRILAGHLRRSVVIGRLLETATKAATTFAQTLDASRAGVVLVDRQRRVVHANGVARDMLKTGDPINAASGVLELPGEVVPGSLHRAIDGASATSAGSSGAGVAARRTDRTPLTVQVLPLEHRVGTNTPGDAVAAVFVADSASGPATSAEILSLLFDLTPAETRVFGLVVDGLELIEIGTQLSISPATAKTHLAHIYAKTGKSSRADLVRLAHEVSLPA